MNYISKISKIIPYKNWKISLSLLLFALFLLIMGIITGRLIGQKGAGMVSSRASQTSIATCENDLPSDRKDCQVTKSGPCEFGTYYYECMPGTSCPNAPDTMVGRPYWCGQKPGIDDPDTGKTANNQFYVSNKFGECSSACLKLPVSPDIRCNGQLDGHVLSSCVKTHCADVGLRENNGRFVQIEEVCQDGKSYFKPGRITDTSCDLDSGSIKEGECEFPPLPPCSDIEGNCAPRMDIPTPTINTTPFPLLTLTPEITLTSSPFLAPSRIPTPTRIPIPSPTEIPEPTPIAIRGMINIEPYKANFKRITLWFYHLQLVIGKDYSPGFGGENTATYNVNRDSPFNVLTITPEDIDKGYLLTEFRTVKGYLDDTYAVTVKITKEDNSQLRLSAARGDCGGGDTRKGHLTGHTIYENSADEYCLVSKGETKDFSFNLDINNIPVEYSIYNLCGSLSRFSTNCYETFEELPILIFRRMGSAGAYDGKSILLFSEDKSKRNFLQQDSYNFYNGSTDLINNRDYDGLVIFKYKIFNRSYTMTEEETVTITKGFSCQHTYVTNYSSKNKSWVISDKTRNTSRECNDPLPQQEVDKYFANK